MKKTIKLFAVKASMLIAVACIASCNNNPKTDSKENAEEHNEAKFTENPSEKDAQNILDAYSGSLFEVEASREARELSADREVKDLASAMITAHEQLNKDLESLAAKKQVSLQKGLTESQSKDLQDWKDKKGKDFNKAYVDKMVSDHEKAISLFEKAAEKTTDADTKNLFTEALPNLRHHLDMAMTLNDKMK